MNHNLENYKIYLGYIDKKVANFFEEQKEYIHCKKGCYTCCTQGNFPVSSIEAEYIKKGHEQLDETLKKIIDDKISKIKKYIKNTRPEFPNHECPFLINNECSIYNYRGIKCRTFGLIEIRKESNDKIPFCAFKGLNYSTVISDDGKTISEEKFIKLNYKNEPKAYNINYLYLTNEKFEKALNIEFNNIKPLIEYL